MKQHSFCFAVGLATFATLLAELSMTRIFSVTMYYHFAFLVISLALLGLAVAGAVIYALPRVFRPERAARLAAGFMIATGASAVIALKVALDSPIQLTRWDEQLGTLALVYVAAAVPFISSGFAVTLAITRASAGGSIGRVYAFDLVGASLGCLAVVPATSLLDAPGVVLAAGAAAGGAAVLFVLSGDLRARGARALLALGGALAVVLAILAVTEGEGHRFGAARNPSKFLGSRQVLFEKWNAFSQITVARAGQDDHRWIFIDADAATRLWSGDVLAAGYAAPRRIPEVRVASLAYALRHEAPALIIGPGGGTDVISALYHGVPRVLGVEINPIIVEDVMRGAYAAFTGGLYVDHPKVEIVVGEARSYIRRTDEKFGVIQATLVDTWAASSSGAFTLSENNLYTVEAFDEFLAHLRDDGVLIFTRWYDPRAPKEFVRLVALARAALERRGVPAGEVARHVIAVADTERRASLLVGVRPFSAADVALVQRRAAEDRLTLVHAVAPADGAALGTDALIRAQLAAPDAGAFLARLPYDATPTTDDRPFFFYSTRLGDLGSVFGGKGADHNLGVAMLLVLFGFTLAATALLVFVPLLAGRRAAASGGRTHRLRLLGFFACLGLGFILVEIGLMQRFVLFLGHPIYALVVVLAVLLAASGVGSSLSGRAAARWGEAGAARRAVAAIVGLLVVYALILPPLFDAALGAPVAARVAIAAVLVWIPGVIMGTLLPTGLRVVAAGPADMAPWAWAINGATSVLGSTAAIFISMNFGFTVSLVAGLAIYALAAAAIPPPARPAG